MMPTMPHASHEKNMSKRTEQNQGKENRTTQGYAKNQQTHKESHRDQAAQNHEKKVFITHLMLSLGQYLLPPLCFTENFWNGQFKVMPRTKFSALRHNEQLWEP